MVSEKQMEMSSGKNARIYLTDGKIIETWIEEYVRKEDEDEEPMIFYESRYAFTQSEIKSIEILD